MNSPHCAQPASLYYSVWSADAPLTKSFWPNPDGTVSSRAAAQLYEGAVRRATARDLRDLAQQFDAIGSCEAVTYGLAARDGRVVTKARLADNCEAIARSADHVRFARGPGIAFLDSDAGIGIDELPGLLCAAIPQLLHAPMLARQSASAGIVRTSDSALVNDLGKWHLYIPVRDLSRIVDAGKAMQDLLWAALEVQDWVEPGGSGAPRDVALAWMTVNSAGQALPRTLLDAAVHQPERLDFVARAPLPAGLARLDAGNVFANEGAPLFDLDSIRVTPEQAASAKANRTKARDAVREECEMKRAAWLDERSVHVAAERDVTREEARRVLARALDGGELTGDFMLLCSGGAWVSVHDVWADRERFPDGERFADPIEPEYNNDRRIAVLYTGQGRPRLYSHAHGACTTYELLPDVAAIGFGSRDAALAAEPAQVVDAPPQAGVDVVTSPNPVPRNVIGPTTREQQLSMFAGCVLVISGKSGTATVLTPAGQSLTKGQFDAKFGGHEFMVGGVKNSTTKSAYDAFVGNQDIGFPRADAPGFRPQLPFQALYPEDGLTMVNTYRPLGKRQAGDAAPMLEHVRRLFPVGDDATIVLSALAAMVQYPGRKFTWCLVLQSGPGAGKNMIASAMFTALGAKYCMQLEERDLASQFNGWLADRLLCLFPEMSRRAAAKAMERLKTLITDGRNQGVERKNMDKVATDVCANFLFLSNHRDAIAKDANDRRFCILYSALQTKADLHAAGMGSESAYFRTLSGWLANGGEAIFANWLHEYAIPEQYDPTKGAHVAPATSSTAQAIELGRSDIAEVIAEAIDDEAPGFRGGWLSWGLAKVHAVGKLTARQVSVEGLRLAVASLGFERCPVLPDGKTDNPIQPDGKRATLYSRGITELGSMSRAAIAQAYARAQTSGQFGVQA